jgi:sulfate/thiosulfate-binding protein
MRTPRTRRTLAALTVIVATAAAACGGDDDTPAADTGGEAAENQPAAGEKVELSLVGFAVPEAANKAIQEEWAKTPEGAGVTWLTSYGASGDQSRAVVDGLEADYVHFSVTSDVTRLVDNGLVAEDWDDGPNKGIVSQSVVVLVVRKGNPKGITGWDDLVRDDISIVTPNPGSSGAARWNLMAAWAHATDAGAKPDSEGEAYLEKFFANVTVLAGSGREATTAFTNGDADVLISYENEAILARQNDQGFDYIVPDTTMLIENPGAVLIDAHPRTLDWLEFVLGPEGQYQFAQKGFRPIIDVEVGEVEGANDPANPYPEVERLLTVATDFESWSALSEKFFHETDGIVTKVIAASGKAEQ